MSKITKGRLTHRVLYSCTHMSAVGDKGLISYPTSERDECVGSGIDVAPLTSVRPVVTSSYPVDTESRVDGTDILVYIAGDRVPIADDRRPCSSVVPADGVRVSGEAADEVSAVSRVGLDASLYGSGCRRDCHVTTTNTANHNSDVVP